MPEVAGGLVVVYDPDCAVCRAAARWLRRRDRWRRLDLRPIADAVEAHGRRLERGALEAEMHVVDRRGRVYRGFRGWRRIARDIPVLIPLVPVLWLPGAVPVGDVAYRWVARHRAAIGRGLGIGGTSGPDAPATDAPERGDD